MATASKAPAYMVLVVAGFLGWLSMLAFVAFLFHGSADLVDLDLGGSGSLWFDAGLCLLFFVQHSCMIRRSFRRRLALVIRERYMGAVFTIASAVPLLALVVLWQGSGQVLAAPSAPIRWLLHALFVGSMAGMVWGLLALGSFDGFGLGPIRDYLRGSSTPPPPFTIRGPYRWVRHPLYVFFLVLFWAHPDLTADRLLLNGLWTAWVVVGTVLEERDLVAAFGEDYRDYQRKVPMLIPWRLRPALPSAHSQTAKE